MLRAPQGVLDAAQASLPCGLMSLKNDFSVAEEEVRYRTRFSMTCDDKLEPSDRRITCRRAVWLSRLSGRCYGLCT